MSDLSQAIEFRPTLLKDALRRHIWLLLLLPLVGALLGMQLVGLLPAQKQSVASVLINPLYGNPFAPGGSGDQLTNLETEAQIVTSDVVAAIAAENLPGDLTGPELSRLVRGVVPANTQVIRITSTSDSASAARSQAQAFAEAFLEYRRRRTQELVKSQLKTLGEQEKSARESLSKATRDMAAQAIDSAGRALYAEQVRTSSTELARLAAAIAESAATPSDPGQIISPANLPADTGNAASILGAVAGLVLGLGAAVLAAIARERLDDRLRNEADLDRLHVGWLGTLSDPTAVVSSDRSELTEEVRRLRTVVLSALRQRPTVLAVGCAEQSGQIAASARPLAVALARAGVRVCLLNAGSHGKAEVVVSEDNPGFAGLLLREALLDGVMESTARNLVTIPRGSWVGAVSDVLGSESTTALLERLKSDFEIVLIAAPSLDSADGRLLAAMADVAVIEATALRTTNAQVIHVTDQLRQAGIELLGAIIVGPLRARDWRKLRKHPGTSSPEFEGLPARPSAGSGEDHSPVTGPAPSTPDGVTTPPGAVQPASSPPVASPGTRPIPDTVAIRVQTPTSKPLTEREDRRS